MPDFSEAHRSAEHAGRPSVGVDHTREAVTVIMGVVVGLTFMFGFGMCSAAGFGWACLGGVAPLVAPATDLSVLALLLATRHLALNGASVEELRPARGLLLFASLVTLALNVADPLLVGEWGKAAFDAVGPLLLIGWAHVGPNSSTLCRRPVQLRLRYVMTASMVGRTS